MKFISYAQNFEDVMLWRALRDVEEGFYIDVGANYPKDGSVTKAFYDKGWTGVNIEPEENLYKLLENDRPNDTNLNVAVSNSAEVIDFYISTELGWSTTNKINSDELQKRGQLSRVVEVPTISLNELCAQYNVNTVHFLKIDVEGSEHDVLQSMSFNDVRPWVIVIEATAPRTQTDMSSEWEYLLTDKNYICAYFDGINKYFVAKEHFSLLDKFTVPPNLFDDFVLYSQVKAEKKACEAEAKMHEAEAKMHEAEAKMHEAEAKMHEAEAKRHEAEQRYNSIIRSRSWKIIRYVAESRTWKILSSLVHVFKG
jgi:FkbM family methyltransferase